MHQESVATIPPFRNATMCIPLPLGVLAGAGILGCVAAFLCAADEPPKAAEPGTLLVIDPAGKEQKLKSWTWVAGTRHLAFLAPADKEPEPPKDKAPKDKPKPVGPEALEFREETSTVYADGILTLIPLDRLRGIDYDIEKEMVTARVATGPQPDDDVKLTGLTKFLRINKIIIEAEVDKGDLGLAEVKFLGGVQKGGMKGIRFPPPKVEAAPAGGRPAVVTSADRTGKATHKVVDLLPLYRVGETREQTAPLLFFKKTLKIDVAKIKTIVPAGPDDEEKGWQVVLKDGNDENLSLLRDVTLGDRPAKLIGILARVPAGYKLFPLHTLAEIRFDTTDEGSDK
jgi:hypothetical protein